MGYLFLRRYLKSNRQLTESYAITFWLKRHEWDICERKTMVAKIHWPECRLLSIFWYQLLLCREKRVKILPLNNAGLSVSPPPIRHHNRKISETVLEQVPRSKLGFSIRTTLLFFFFEWLVNNVIMSRRSYWHFCVPKFMIMFFSRRIRSQKSKVIFFELQHQTAYKFYIQVSYCW